MAVQVASLTAKISADTASFDAGMKSVKTGLQGGAQSLDQFKTNAASVQSPLARIPQALKSIGAAAAGMTAALLAAKAVFDFGQQGAMLARLEASGESLAASYGASMDSMLASMQKAAHGTVAQTDLILSANRAMMLGVTADADQMANLLEVAALRGRAMGLSTSQAFNDIVTGIGRMSPLILDNLGIVTNMTARVQEWADANGVSAESVDDATKKQILLQQVLEDGNKQLEEHGGLVLDTASAYEKFGAQSTDAWNRVKKEFGEFIEPAVSGLADYMEGLNNAAEAQEYLGAEFVAGHEAGTGVVNMYRLATGELVTMEEMTRKAFEAQRLSNHETERAAMLHGILFPQVENTAEAFMSAAQALDFYNGVNTNLNSTIDSTLEKINLEAIGIQGLEGHYEDLIAQYHNGNMALQSIEANLEGTRSAAILASLSIGQIGDDEAREKLALLGLSIEEINRLLRLMAGTYDIKVVLDLISRFGGGGAEQILKMQGKGGGGANVNNIQKQARGGTLGSAGTGIVEVGEQGKEGMIYDPRTGKWVVIPHDEWMSMKGQGVTPSAGMASGGILGGVNNGPQAEGFQISKGGGFLSFSNPQWIHQSGGPASAGRYVNPGRQRVGDGAWVSNSPGTNGYTTGPGNNGSNNGGSQQAAAIAAAVQSATQAAAQGSSTTAIQQSSQASAQAIEQASADAQRSAAETQKILQKIHKDMLRRTDLSNEFADALAKAQ